MKFIVLDTETTGATEEDRICQLSYLVLDEEGNIEEVHDDLCIPPLAIKYDAMAIHHITPEMIEDKPECIQTKAFKRLNELNIPDNVMVIQNAKFDLDMLAKEDFKLEMSLIDTFRILRFKYPLDESNGLQYKRYQLGLYKKEQEIIEKLGIEIKAHDALGDVIVLKNLFDYLQNEISIDEMIKLCAEPILLKYMPFGKFKGKIIEELALNERNNLDWMLGNFDLDEDVKHTISHYIGVTKESMVLTLGFGKYKGMTPAEIGDTDPQYLTWLLNNAERLDNEIRKEIIDVLNT